MLSSIKLTESPVIIPEKNDCQYDKDHCRRDMNFKNANLHFVCFFFLFPTNVQSAAAPQCNEFYWKTRDVKPIEACDLLKDLIPVWISKLTNRSECISSLELTIGEMKMKTNHIFDGYPQQHIFFENLLADGEATIQQKPYVTVFARVNGEGGKYLQTNFNLEASNCTSVEETRLKGKYIIVSTVTSVVGALAATMIVFWLRKRRCTKDRSSKPEVTDLNDTYGTYSRGWYGEGEYGDGDKVYVIDSNGYYDS